jgi:hypothetical protein
LAHQQISLRAAIAPSGILAQFALLRLLHTPASSQAPLTIPTPEQAADLLRSLPIAALTRLQFPDPTTITTRTLAQAVSRLEDYGVRSLQHLARLDNAYLRRQFGARVGPLLAAIARGEDLLRFQPTSAPLRLRFRLRLTSPVTPDRLLRGLAPFACEVASKFARRGLHGHTLELRLRWESGSPGNSARDAERITTIIRTLPQPLSGGRTLPETLERMLAPHLQAHARAHAHHAHEAIEGLHLTISHLTPRYPAHHAFWPQRARRLAATQELADLLARRHGKPLLFQSLLTAPDAIFDQDRSHLAPLNADVADVADVADMADVADVADVTEGLGHPARLAADVADTKAATDAEDASDAIQHGIHWW